MTKQELINKIAEFEEAITKTHCQTEKANLRRMMNNYKSLLKAIK